MYAELLKELMEGRKKYYVADSIDAPEVIGYETDQLQTVVSESIDLTRNLFEEMCEVDPIHENIHNPQFGYCDGEDMAWVYDPEEDMHYFYR